MLSGSLIVSCSLITIIISALKIELFLITILVSLVFDGFSNLFYVTSKNVEKNKL